MTGKVTVLIVEESRTFSMYLALLLRRMGLQSLTAGSIESAARILARGIVDFLIVGDQADQTPPSRAVKSLAEAIAAAGVPVLTVSVRDDSAEREACHAAGCHAYLLKPVQPRQLHEALYSSLVFPTGQRKHLRSSLDLTADVGIPGQGTGRLRILTLSRGGALLATPGSLATGTVVSLDLSVNGQFFALTGSIIYNRKDVDEQTPHAAGVLFHKLDPWYGDLIDDYLESVLAEERQPPEAAPGRSAGPREFSPGPAAGS